MPQAGTGTVSQKQAGLWIGIDGLTNIVVGVKGSSYEIQVHLGDETSIYPAGRPASGITIIAKAAAYRVVNKGAADLTFEGFA